jgi:hypothetical protein
MSPDFDRLLRQARDVLPGPDDDATRRARQRALAAIGGGRRLRSRSALVLVAALLVAAGLGIGVGALVTPSGSAAPAPVGLGFLPEQGWSVLQNGGDGTPLRPAVAVAANVPISLEDDPDGLPYSTLLSLPPDGIVIVAEFLAVGEEAGPDTLPLRARDAAPRQLGAEVRPERPLGQYELRAFVNGYAVDLHIYYGTRRPSAALMAAAQRQLDRLVVAPDRVTIEASLKVARWGFSFTLFGRVASDAEEEVTIEAKGCAGPPMPFHALGSVQASGGTWSTPMSAVSTTVFRAKWGDATSATLTVQVRPSILLQHRFSHQYSVGVRALVPFWRKHVVLQRFNRRAGAWVDVKTIVLTEQAGTGISVVTSAKFRTVVPKGTLLRAVLPLSQARPCYVAGFSNLLRT